MLRLMRSACQMEAIFHALLSTEDDATEEGGPIASGATHWIASLGELTVMPGLKGDGFLGDFTLRLVLEVLSLEPMYRWG